ncbi:MAG: hypothetical protein INR70_15710 [Parafilimonas terrae]|nr:hypothetical protein [Parafilimonas terrae]
MVELGAGAVAVGEVAEGGGGLPVGVGGAAVALVERGIALVLTLLELLGLEDRGLTACLP